MDFYASMAASRQSSDGYESKSGGGGGASGETEILNSFWVKLRSQSKIWKKHEQMYVNNYTFVCMDGWMYRCVST